MAIRIPLLALLLLTLALSAAGAPVPAFGAAFTVDSTTDAVDANPGDGACASAAGDCTLRAAIQETNALAGADAITLPAGVFVIALPGVREDAGATGDFDLTDDVIVQGAGPDETILDALGLDRVVHTSPLANALTVTLRGLTIRHGDSVAGSLPAEPAVGGGILNGPEAGLADQAQLTLEDVAVLENRGAGSGGGIFNAAELVMIRSTVSRNIGGLAAESPFGGGIASVGPSVNIEFSVISSNTSEASGGGIWGRSITIEDTTVSDNAAGSGGGLVADGLTIRRSVITGNIGGVEGVPDRGSGGGIIAFGEMTTVTGTTISGNHANVLGGGILVIGNVSLIGTTVSDNSSDRFGGGIAVGGLDAVSRSTVLRLMNSTVSANKASRAGGGVSTGGTTDSEALQMQNATLAHNDAPTGSAILSRDEDLVSAVNSIFAASTGPACSGRIVSLGYNIGTDDSCGLARPGDRMGADPLLNPLLDNGGRTETHALRPGSPALDSGDDASCPPTDQRGMPRSSDGDGDGVAVCDIGAYEAPGVTQTTRSPTPSSQVTPAAVPRTGRPTGTSPSLIPAALTAAGIALMLLALETGRNLRRMRRR
jgi:CSLREA domain-containing protein